MGLSELTIYKQKICCYFLLNRMAAAAPGDLTKLSPTNWLKFTRLKTTAIAAGFSGFSSSNRVMQIKQEQ